MSHHLYIQHIKYSDFYKTRPRREVRRRVLSLQQIGSAGRAAHNLQLCGCLEAMIDKDLTQCLIVQGHFGDYLRHALFQANLDSPGDALVIVAAHHGDLYRALLQEAVAEGHHAAGGLVPENLAFLRQLADQAR